MTPYDQFTIEVDCLTEKSTMSHRNCPTMWDFDAENCSLDRLVDEAQAHLERAHSNA